MHDSPSPPHVRENERPDQGRENAATSRHSNKRRRSGAPRNCAECRRLKLRCDKVFPCVSCVKRGLAAICPDGCLTTGQGNRFVLASTEELHEKIAILSHRIRTLEDALRETYAKLASDCHPLLNDELLSLKAPLQRDAPSGQLNDSSQQHSKSGKQEQLVEALGSLSIRDKGSVNYFGHTANSWYLLQNEDTEDIHPGDSKSTIPQVIPPHLVESPGAFLLSLLPTGLHEVSGDSCQQILSSLPSPTTAKHLRDIYFAYAAWHYSPIQRDQFDEDVFQYFYEREFTYSSHDYALFQRVATLFLVFAIGAAMDPANNSHSVVAERYHQLALASLFHGRPMERPTLHSVQALFLAFSYSYFVDRHDSCEQPSRWTLLGMVIRLGQAIGLHRDSTKFGLPEKEAHRRRILLCEIRYADCWQAVSLGRPPGMFGAHVDNTPPVPGKPEGCHEISLAYKHRWLTECLSILQDEAYGSKTPTHAQVMRLDRVVRSFAMPIEYTKTTQLGVDNQEPPEYVNRVAFMLQRASALAGREITYMYLHRSFFLRAILDRPEDPATGPYGSSFLACYKAAVGALQVVKDLYATAAKDTLLRIWFWWSHLASCAVIFATVISKCPSNSLAPSALEHLDTCVDFFAIVAERFRAQKLCATITALRDKAHRAITTFRASPGMASPGTNAEEDDESIAALGGRTRIISPRVREVMPDAPEEVALREMRAILGLDMGLGSSPSPSLSSGSSVRQSSVESATGVGASAYHMSGGLNLPAQVSPPTQPWNTGTTYFDTPLHAAGEWSVGQDQNPSGGSAPMTSYIVGVEQPSSSQNSWSSFGFY